MGKYKIKVPAPKRRLPISVKANKRHKSEKDYDRKREKTRHRSIIKLERCETCGHVSRRVDDECEECAGREWNDLGKERIWSFTDVLVSLKILEPDRYDRNEYNKLDVYWVRMKMLNVLIPFRY